jgi:hypothetical protein
LNSAAKPTVEASGERYVARAERWAQWIEAARTLGYSNDEGELSVEDALAACLAEAEGLLDRGLSLAEQKIEAANRRALVEAKALRESIAALEAARDADRQAHSAALAEMRAVLERQAKDHATNVDKLTGEIELLADQLAEQRAIDRLRSSRSGRAHASQVELRLARQELAREAKGYADGRA